MKQKQVPEVRFRGFSDVWEQLKGVDIADYSKGRGYSKNDIRESGTPIILYGRLYTNYQFAINDVDTYAVPKEGSVYSQGNEVIIPSSGETPEDIARASAVRKPGILLGGDLNILRPISSINPIFLALSISYSKPQKELAKRAQGKSVVHIHNSDIQEIDMSFPSKKEQSEIVTMFQNIDSLITLHKRKLEKLKDYKKAMLDTMFPKEGETKPQIRFEGFTDDWEVRRLGDMCNIGTGKLDSNHAVPGGKYAFFTCSKETLRIDTFSFDGKAILINGNGDLGYTRKYHGRFDAYQRTYVLMDFSEDFTFLETAIHRYLPQAIAKEGIGGAMPYIKLQTLSELLLSIPKKKEQYAVGGILNKIEGLIIYQQSNINKLIDFKTSMLDKMFVGGNQ